MSQRSDPQSKPSIDTAKTKANQPTLKELSPEQLDKVAGGQKVQIQDLHIPKTFDKTSP